MEKNVEYMRFNEFSGEKLRICRINKQSDNFNLREETQTSLDSLRKHAYSNTIKISPPKTENFQIKTPDIFLVSAQNIDCGHSLEPPR